MTILIFGDMPSLMDDSNLSNHQPLIVPDSLDGNVHSGYSISPEFVSDPVPQNVRKDMQIVSRFLWGGGGGGG